MKTVFRVQLDSRLQNRVGQRKDAVHRPRRTHQKSRYGCHNCKRRRVKCDENVRGGCGNCRRHGIGCDYANSLVHPSVSTINSKLSPRSRTDSAQSTPSVLVGQPCSTVQLCRAPSFVSPMDLQFQQPDDIAPVLQTLSFFETFTCSTVSTIDGMSVFRDSILALSHHCDYLLHAILGISAAHLRSMNGVMDNQQQSQRYSKTEAYHWHRAIKRYRVELANEANLEHMDSLITTSMLLGLYNFQVVGPEDTSFVNAPEAERQAKLQWLVIPMGLLAVLRHVEQHMTLSAWFRVFNTATPAEYGWTIELEPAKGIFADFLEICSIQFDIDDDRNPYKHALKDLFALFQIERLTMRDMGQVVAFMSRLNGQFQGLLVALDSRALLMLLYWLAILDKLGLWWARGRAAQESHAIIQYLELNGDSKIRDLLEIPKMMLRHNVGIRLY